MIKTSWGMEFQTTLHAIMAGKDVDLLTLTTKRQIDLHPELKSLLADWKRQRPRGQLVLAAKRGSLPLPRDQANRLFWQPLRKTKWTLSGRRKWFKLGFHTYRHSFASNLAAAGIDQRIIDEFMGHQTDEMRRRYRHLFPAAKRSAIVCFSLVAPATSSAAMTPVSGVLDAARQEQGDLAS